MSRGQAHGAGLATGIELAAGERETAERAGCIADGVYFSVGRGVVGLGHGVDAFSDDLAIADDDCAEGTAGSADDVLSG